MSEDVGNYTVGRGEVSFARFNPGTLVRGAYRYLGNTPEFSITAETENLDHYNSDRGIREKDATVAMQVTRSLSLVADEITGPNLALFFFGENETVTVAGGGSAVTEPHTGVHLNQWYPLGVTDDDPVGVLKVVYPGVSGTLFKVTNTAGSTTYVAGDDYIFDPVSAMVKILAGGAILEGGDIKIVYTEAASSYELITSSASAVTGALKYVTRNPIGPNRVFTLPYVVIRPNGDYNLKGDDWQSLPFTGEILRLNDLEAVYINGVPG